MNTISKKAQESRRCTEHILTAFQNNATYSGARVATYARKEQIWPPISNLHITVQSELGKIPISSPQSRPGDIADSPVSAASEVEGTLLETLQTLNTRDDILYHPLHVGQMIRLLEIHPGSFDDSIECSFHYADLQRVHSKYDALSYVWGKSERNRYDEETKQWAREKVSVRCNGQDISVTPNLESAIRHVRSRSAGRLLWADALCINQEDHQERTHQVGLMASIYRSAATVIIIAGSRSHYERGIWNNKTDKRFSPPKEFEDVKAQRAFGAVCEIVNCWQGTQLGEQRATYKTLSESNDEWSTASSFEEYPTKAKACEDQELMQLAILEYYHGEEKSPPPDIVINCTPQSAPDSQFWMSLKELFRQAWFWRVWVIQEAVLARNATVKWGNVEMEWRWLGLASAILRTNYHSICEAMHMGGVYNAYLMFRLSSMSDLAPLQVSFYQLLRMTRQFSVTDPRDRVYGLLGMKTNDNDPDQNMLFLSPDYLGCKREI